LTKCWIDHQLTHFGLPCYNRLHLFVSRTYDRTPDEKQLFRYAHRGRKIPYCILTNFQRLHVFNADHERLILAFDSPTEYLDRLSELLRLSPEKVKAGSLPAWERQLEIKDVDEAFLASLQHWRKLLANAIYRDNINNPMLQSNRSLDFLLATCVTVFVVQTHYPYLFSKSATGVRRTDKSMD